MPFKFERLEVWQMSLDYIDLIYEIASELPRSEEYNLKSQIRRAATSVALNIAEGSTGQTDAEQARFLGLAIRSLLETVACQHRAVALSLDEREKPGFLLARRRYLPCRSLARKPG